MNKAERFEKIAEGKTKIIWDIPGADEVLIESKDDITAGNGKKHDKPVNKGVLATTTTCNCFRLLEREGVPTHFIEQVDERTFRAHWVHMIPIELVARRIAAGSYLKRNPTVEAGTRFDDLVIEFFLKDDDLHDPLMLLNDTKHCFDLFDANKLITNGYMGELCSDDYKFIPEDIETIKVLRGMLNITFLILEDAFAEQDVTLVDLKTECGYNREGMLLVADVLDADSWRTLPPLDKQAYRDGTKSLSKLMEDYRKVAEVTKKFLL